MRPIFFALTLCALLTMPALADPVFTGNVTDDFADLDTQIFFDYRNDQYRDYVEPEGLEKDVGLPVPPFTAEDISGWDIKASYYYYNKSSDRLYVGLDFYEIGGDADGDGDPSGTSSMLAAKGGVDYPGLTQEESICVTFDTTFDGVYDVIVGISSFASITDFGTFTFVGDKNAPALGFGTKFDPDPAVLYCIPNTTCPDFEFYIDRFSELPGFSFSPGESFEFRTRSFGGSLGDDGIGEDMVRSWVYYNLTDMGDAPSSYSTLLADQGAAHKIVHGMRLGALIDDETDGQPSDNATGDDLDGVDDEDGIVFKSKIMPGTTATIEARVQGTGMLNAWLDLNRNGRWDADEEVLKRKPLSTGTKDLSFYVPQNANPGVTFARFRFSSSNNISFNGPAEDGEVEDYEVNITPPLDRGDAPDSYRTLANSSGPSHVIVPNFYLGYRVDAELDGQPNDNATGDDLSGVDDEDGIAFKSQIMPGTTATAEVRASGTGKLNAWLDFDHSGTWEPEETIFENADLAQGINTLHFSVPRDAKPGTTFARFRFSSSGNLFADGPAKDGEVEDYLVQIVEALDWGDAPDSYRTLALDQGASHRIIPDLHLGSEVDAELDGQPNDNATGDDLSGMDDEDGVSFSHIYTGNPSKVTVNASWNGKLSAWMDFNGDGIWSEPTERILTDADLTAGNNELTFEVPSTALPGTSIARFRFSTTAGLSSGGFAPDNSVPDGEVEDHQVTIEKSASLGDHVWMDANKNGLQDSGEHGLSGVLVDLFESDSTLVGSTTTDADGRYGFEDIVPGDYYLVFHALQYYSFSPKDRGDDSVDSDADVNGETDTISLASGQVNLNWDTGLYVDANINASKTAIPDSGAPSTNITFVIKVTNTGNVTLNPVEAKDTLPEGLSYVSDNSSGSRSGKVVTWGSLDSLEPGASKFIQMIAHVDGSVFGELTNLVEVIGQPPTGDSVNNSTTTNIIAFRPNIEVNKTAIPDSGAPSTNIEFVIKVKNTGNVTLNPVEAKDTLPDGLSYVSDNRSGSLSGRTITWSNLGPLEPDESESIQLIAHVDGDVFGDLVNLVDVTGRPPTGNNVTNSTTTNVTAFKPNIEVSKTALPDSGAPSTNIEFVIEVKNTGNVTLNLVEAKDVLPQGLSYVSDNRNGSVSGKVVTWSNLGLLEPEESEFISLVAHVDGDVFGELVNLVDVIGRPPIGNDVTNSTTTNVTAFRPNIEVSKTALPDSGAPSTNIEFVIKVKNIGNVTLNSVEAKDTLPEGLSYVSDNRSGSVSDKVVTWTNLGPLEPEESKSIRLVAHIDGNVFGKLTNLVDVTGKPPSGNSVTNSTTTNITALHPGIEVNKTAIPDSGAPSTNIEFVIKVTNSGNVTLNPVEAKDTLPEGLSYVSDNSSGSTSGKVVTWTNLGSLQPEESRFIQLVAHVDGDVFGELTNLVEVIGQPPTGNSVNNSTTTNVIAFKPNVEVNKTAIPDSGAPSTNIEFTIKVKNTGNVKLDLIEVKDNLPQGLSYVSDNSSGSASGKAVTWTNLGPLEPDESRIIQLIAHVDGDVFGKLINLVDVTSRPTTGNDVTNSTTTNVTALRPDIEVNKTATPNSGAPSTNIEFIIEARNTGNVTLDLAEVMDTLPEGLSYVSDDRNGSVSDDRNGSVSGRTITWNDLGSLRPGESEFIGLVAHVDGDAFGQLVNSVEVIGKPPTGNNVTNTTTANIIALRPNIQVTKKANPEAGAPSTEIKFAIEVKNTGNITLNLAEITDALPEGLSYVSDDRNGSVLGKTVYWNDLGSLEPGESRFIELIAHVDGGVYGQLTNSVQVVGKPPTGDNITNSTTTSITALKPNIEVVKTVNPSSGAPSTEIEFAIEVRNTGNVTLNSVEARDSLPQGLSYVSDNHSGTVDGDGITWSLGVLEPGKSEFIGLVAHVDGDAFGKLTNFVQVIGEPPTGDSVTNSTTVDVTALRPNIEVVKMASPEAGAPSTEIEFAIKVTNTGNVTLDLVEVADALPEGLSYVSDNLSGKIDDNRIIWANLGSFEPGESKFIGLVAHVDGDIFGELANLVEVIGKPPTGNNVTNTTTANIAALKPNIQVTKKANPEAGAPSTEIEFAIEVRNTGNVTLDSVEVTDTLPEGLSYVSDNRNGKIEGNRITWNNLGPLKPGRSEFIGLVAHVDGNVLGELTNLVEVIGKPTTGDNVTNTTTTNVTALKPDIEVVKTANPDLGAPSTNIEFIIEAKNTGNVTLDLAEVVDTLPKGLSYVSDDRNGSVSGKTISWNDLGSLKPGEAKFIGLVAHIDGNAFGRLTNSVQVVGKPTTGDSIINTTTADVTALKPNIDVAKTANPGAGAPSTQIEFAIKVTNTGNVTLDLVEVVDALPDGLSYIRDNQSGTIDGNKITWNKLGSFEPGESKFIGLVAHIDGDVLGELANLVEVIGKPPTGNSITNSTTTNVTALKPNIAVTKTANPDSGSPSTNIEFTIKVANTGNVTLNSVEATDSLPAGLSYVRDNQSGSVSGKVVSWPNLGQLSPGESKSINLVAHVDGDAFGKLTNLVDVTGRPPTGNDVTNSTTTTVTALSPDIEVDKTALPDSGAPSTNIEFTIEVKNTGNVKLDLTEVKDTLPQGLSYISDNSSGSASGKAVTWTNLGPLEPDESRFIQLIAHIDGDLFGELTNLVEVVGKPPTGDNVTNSTTANVTALNPNIEIVKTANPDSGSPSTEIEFLVKITNTGNVDLDLIEVTDALPDGLSYVSDNRSGSVSGKAVTWNDLGRLEPDESRIIQLIAHVDGGVFGELANLVEVIGKPPTGDNIINSTTTNIIALKPNIEVIKIATPSSGAPSTEIEFVVEVRNTGNATLNSVEAKDTLPQGLSYVSDNRSGTVDGHDITWSLGPLQPGESEFVGLTAHVDGDVLGELTNLVEVIGKPSTGDNVTNTTTTNVTALKPDIEVVKTANPDSAAPSTNIEFVIKVKNTGSVDLNLVEVTDAIPDGLSYVSDNRSGSVSGKTIAWNDLGSLGPGKSGFIELVAHVDGDVFGRLTNSVQVVGKPSTGDNVTNSTAVDVTALRPNIEVVKTASPEAGAPSTEIEFAIKVTNTGNVTLDSVAVTDALPGGLSYVSDNRSGSVSGKIVTWTNLGSLEPGESKSIQLMAHVDGDIFGELTNRVNVTGRPPTGDSVTNSTTTNVTAFKPNIEVTKSAIPDSESPPTDVTFIIRVINSGNVILNSVVAKDTLLYGLSYVSDNQSGIVSGDSITWNNLGSLATGESKFISLVAHVDRGIYNTANRVNVTGKPPIGENVTNSTTVYLDLQLMEYSIFGRKFNDLDADGTHDGDSDPGIPGWAIELVDESGEVVATATTDENGLYQIDNVPTGNYIVREVNQPGWLQTCPALGYYEITVDYSDVDEMDFGNQRKGATLGDFVWKDLNLNGVQDPEEPGVPGIKVRLYRAIEGIQAESASMGEGPFGHEGEGTLLCETETDAQGHYRFSDLEPGSYYIEFEKPAGCCFTPCDQGGDDDCDCDACEDDGCTMVFHLDAGEVDLRWDAGIQLPSTIEVTKAARPASASPGAEIDFEIEIFNRGETTLSHVKALDILPRGMSYVSDDHKGDASGRTIAWNDLGSLDPEKSLVLHLVGRIDKDISGTLTNVVYAKATDPADRELNASAKADVESLLPGIEVEKTLGLPEPLQFGEYCEAKAIKGKGHIESRMSVVDKKIALEYDSTMAGEGEIELESSQAMSQAASRLQRNVSSHTRGNESRLNFFEQTKLNFKGSKPLMGGKSIRSKEFYGGSGAKIEEFFNVKEMEESQTVYFGSTERATSPQVMSMDMKSRFEGTRKTESQIHKMFNNDVLSRQSFSGRFEIEKMIKLHEKARKSREPKPEPGCDGIDC